MNIYTPVIRSIRYNKLKCCTTCITERYTSTSVESTSGKKNEIVIPHRIPRGPTDILQALANTITRDPTAPHYKFHDDPYLIPTSNLSKRTYALAQESGRKAAHWIRQEHKELFLYTVSDPPLRKLSPYKNADPPIEAYIPRPVYNENTDVCEQDLITVVKNSLVTDAKTVYNLLEVKNPGSISADTRQQLLELMCFHNESEPLPEDWIEEKWFRQGESSRSTVTTVVWKDRGVAEAIFAGMENKTDEAYCAMIQGMCKYYQAERAYQLFEESKTAGIKLNTKVYNALLSVVGFLKEGIDLRWQMTLDLLKDMDSQGLAPNIGTLNSTLYCLSLQRFQFEEKACSIITEFLKNGVQPSLATYYYIIEMFYKDRLSKNDVMYLIMDQLEGKELTIQDPKDTNFFVTAMNICRYRLQDINLANRLHALLLYKSNYDLIGDSYKESVYYRHYFTLMCRSVPLENFMQLYNELVPHVYIPESSIMEEIIRMIDADGACDHYPLIWSHMVMFRLGGRQPLVQYLLESMVRNLPNKDVGQSPVAKTDTSGKLVSETLGGALIVGLETVRQRYAVETLKPETTEDKFAKIAWDIWTRIEGQSEERPKSLAWTGNMLSDVIALLVPAERLEDAKLVVNRLVSEGQVIGVPNTPEPLLNFARAAVTNKTPSYAATALSYLSENGFAEAQDGAIELIEVILNRPKEEVKKIVDDARKNGINSLTSDSNIASLLSVLNPSEAPTRKGEKKDSSKKEDSSSGSSSSSDSDSSDDEADDIESLKDNLDNAK